MGSNSAECGHLRGDPLLTRLPQQRWQLPAPLPEIDDGAEAIVALGLEPEILAVLRRRGYGTAEAIGHVLEPAPAPDPHQHFSDLSRAVQRLSQACAKAEAVAICGDYDADGMTSTALLVGVLQRLGARPVAAIPSRLDDGYGLNAAMVERLAEEGIALLVTVDNGIAAVEALERAQALQVEVDPHRPPHPATAASPLPGPAASGLHS